MTTALIIGGISFNTMIYVDEFPAPAPGTVFASNYHETIGSTGAGKALNMARLAFDVTLHGLLGDDANGQLIRDYMKSHQVNLITDSDSAGTQRHINWIDKNGERVSFIINSGTFEPQLDQSRLNALIQQSDIVHLSIVNYARHFIPIARKLNKSLWMDLHDYDGKNPYYDDFIAGSDIIFLSDDAMPDYRVFMQNMINAGKEAVICTHGKRGSTALTSDGRWIETPILPYEYVDSNGAGDAFISGCLYGYTQGYDIDKWLKMGTIAGGLCITSKELASPDLSPDMIESEYTRHYA